MMSSVERGTVLWVGAILLLAIISSASACSDRHPSCPVWAQRGECYKNRGYMHIHCAESCHQCLVQDESCRDLHEQCPAWANTGECGKNYAYMRKTCSRACTFCQPASDHSVPHVRPNEVEKYWEKYQSRYPAIAISHG